MLRNVVYRIQDKRQERAERVFALIWSRSPSEWANKDATIQRQYVLDFGQFHLWIDRENLMSVAGYMRSHWQSAILRHPSEWSVDTDNRWIQRLGSGYVTICDTCDNRLLNFLPLILQIGLGNVRTCSRHNAHFGPPLWGDSGHNCTNYKNHIPQPCPKRDFIYCCDQVITMERKEGMIDIQVYSINKYGIVFSKWVFTCLYHYA